MPQRPVAIITGASSGIGRATALAYARKGYAVVLAARRAGALAEVAAACGLAGGTGLPVPTDVTDAAQVNALVARAVEAFGRVDVMVNNAGFGVHALVHQISDEQMRRAMAVNFYGVLYGCRAVVPVMQAARRGHIFNVSSVIGKRGSPYNGAYCAAKFAVSGLTESLRVEMIDWHIRVTLVCPGMTATEFFDHVDGGDRTHESSFRGVRGRMSPDVVARRIVAVTGRKTPELVFSRGGRFLIYIATRWPRLADKLMKFYYDDLKRIDEGAGNSPAGRI
ncbi:MAG: SDR family NAD(P)-dependent oxidoreductase [Planctomycetota bacterium]|nr:SDR family NAD(P)-dependent oxidoreductase [Planctomycetota bacterium]